MPIVSGGGSIVSSGQIAPGIVEESDLANGAVTNAKVATNAAIVDTKLATISTAGKVDGAALTGLANIPAGAGQIPSANVNSEWNQLGETTLGSAAASISVSGFSARKDLRVIFRCPSKDGAGTMAITFNSDTGNNYGYSKIVNGADAADSNAQANIDPLVGGNDAQPCYIVMDIDNHTTGFRKIARISVCQLSSTGANAPDRTCEIMAVWNNTSEQITTITIAMSANQFGAGTRMTVYGKKD